MEDKTSIIKLLGLPETFAVLLLTFSFVLFLAPYFSGADFGLFKIPQFTDPARKKFRIIGPIAFLALVVLFVPIIPRNASSHLSNSNQSDTGSKQTTHDNDQTRNNNNSTSPTDVRSQVQQHTKRAEDLYNMGQYEDAIKEYDEALRLDPDNQKALVFQRNEFAG